MFHVKYHKRVGEYVTADGGGDGGDGDDRDDDKTLGGGNDCGGDW